jgi:hypothetical protein
MSRGELEWFACCFTSQFLFWKSLSSAGGSYTFEEAVDLKFSLPNSYDDSVYGRTKLAQLALAQRTDREQVAVHPGGCSTDIQNDGLKFPMPLFPTLYWNHVVRPMAQQVFKLVWFHPSFCAESVLFAAAFAKQGEYFGRFRPIPALFRHEFERNSSYVTAIQNGVLAAIEGK